MISWIRELNPVLVDETHIVMTEQQFKALDAYEASVPTSPSPGRAYRSGGYVYFVVDDPEKPGWQKHVPRKALFL